MCAVSRGNDVIALVWARGPYVGLLQQRWGTCRDDPAGTGMHYFQPRAGDKSEQKQDARSGYGDPAKHAQPLSTMCMHILHVQPKTVCRPWGMGESALMAVCCEALALAICDVQVRYC